MVNVNLQAVLNEACPLERRCYGFPRWILVGYARAGGNQFPHYDFCI